MFNEEVAYKKINSTNAVELRNVGRKLGIYNLNWGGGIRTVVIRMKMYSKRKASAEMWTAKTWF
jgi:hypothetical protein